MHVEINIMILSCSYLGHSVDTLVILILKFKNKSGKKYWETIYKGDLIQDSLKGIPHCRYSWQIIYLATELLPLQSEHTFISKYAYPDSIFGVL